ncbi:MAG: transcriptional repressor [Rhodospirillales bacterium 20-64-7]|nr:MAG: transcriptional repressor [Rhodospirillales bacterium 20-64-7]
MAAIGHSEAAHRHVGGDIPDRLAVAERRCAANGAQLTELRRSVLALILAADGPLTAYQLLDQLKRDRPGAVPPTIYRALEFLLENRLIHRLERLNAFIPCSEAEHAHDAAQFLICGRCGSVAELEDPAIGEALARAAQRTGFKPQRAVVEVEGLCAACAAMECAASSAA